VAATLKLNTVWRHLYLLRYSAGLGHTLLMLHSRLAMLTAELSLSDRHATAEFGILATDMVTGTWPAGRGGVNEWAYQSSGPQLPCAIAQ
jgi:hypothetical protein